MDRRSADLLTVVSGAVSAWRSVKNGFVFSQSISTSRPVYQQDGFGGAPGLLFDGVDDVMYCAETALRSALPANADPGRSVAIVSQLAPAADGELSRYAICHGNGSSTARRLGRSYISSPPANRARLATGDGSSAITRTDTSVEMSSRHVIQGVIGVGTHQVLIDGTGSTVSSTTPATANNRASVGASEAAVAASFWWGHVRDILFTKALSTEKAAALLTWALPRRML